MISILVFIAIFAAVFGLGAIAGATWRRQRQRSVSDSQGWWML